jgi:hypothetical protein
MRRRRFSPGSLEDRMLLTENDAAKKWCPYARAAGGENRAFMKKDGAVPPDDCRCIAALCMAWRWGEPVPKQRFIHHPHRSASTPYGWRPADVPESWLWVPFDGETRAHWLEPEAEAKARRRGHCGAFGAAVFRDERPIGQ